MTKKLICITGMDGAGKSTIISLLAEKIPSVAIANIWDVMEKIKTIPFRSKKDIDGYLCELSPPSRLLFIAHALKYSVDSAIASDKEIILLNGYYFKYFATELALGAAPQLVKDLIGIFPVPDLVVQLDLPVTEAALRKETYSRYECGLAATPGQDQFIAFQQKAMEQWNFFDMKDTRKIDALEGTDMIVQKTLQLIVE